MGSMGLLYNVWSKCRPGWFYWEPDWVGLNNVAHNAPADVYAPTIPHLAYVMFQLMFAAITPALAIAGYADRVKMSAFMIHVVLWTTFVMMLQVMQTGR